MMMNLSLNLFGENVNVFEVGGRLEGYDNLLEEMFGPEGYFKDDTVHNFLKSVMSTRQKRDEGIGQTEISKGNLYMRSFGKDVKFSSFQSVTFPMLLFSILPSYMQERIFAFRHVL